MERDKVRLTHKTNAKQTKTTKISKIMCTNEWRRRKCIIHSTPYIYQRTLRYVCWLEWAGVRIATNLLQTNKTTKRKSKNNNNNNNKWKEIKIRRSNREKSSEEICILYSTHVYISPSPHNIECCLLCVHCTVSFFSFSYTVHHTLVHIWTLCAQNAFCVLNKKKREWKKKKNEQKKTATTTNWMVLV